MNESTCSECGQTAPVRSLYDLNGKTYCETCVQKASENAKRSGQPSAYMPLIDRSICARCNQYIGSDSPAVQIGNRRFCVACSALIKDWDYPQWLKLSLVGLLLLLVVALAHGRKYFHAGRELYVGERLVDQRRYAAALPHLQEALRVAPGSDKASLLAAKAALLTGDVHSAQKALEGHNHGYFEDADKPEFREVNAMWERALQALKKAEQASEIAQVDGKEAEASRLMHEAAAMYPEMPALALGAEDYDAGAAFARRDYDAFLALAEQMWKEHPMSETASQLASALSCKYAVTGDPATRARADEMLAKARQLAQGDPEELKSLDEFAERYKYRLDSRQVISKQEYDLRFRNGKNLAK